MCGIAGIFAYGQIASPVQEEELIAVRDAMATRGPDGAGLWISPDRRIGLAHRRLAIIDTTDAAAQPMRTRDARLHITFNGEIYNYRDLRRELQGKGYVFSSESDTEVLLYLYQERGAEMVNALRGMYAFAIFDTTLNACFLARDPFGIKPLYYADDGNTFRFASQVKALLKSHAVPQVPCAAGHVGFYLWGSVPEPHTLYRDIASLPAGATMIVERERGVQRARRFFDVAQVLAEPLLRDERPSFEESATRLSCALRDTVKHHLVADVPVGVFLSAGLDSATITALAAELSGAPLHTITLGFDEYRGSANDESAGAAQIAELYETKHETRWVERAEFEQELERLLTVMDQPSIDGINTYFVSRAAAQAGLKVALSGLGGDEIFGGYPSFRQIPKLVAAIAPVGRMPGLGKLIRRLAAPIARRCSSPKSAGIAEFGGTYAGAYLLKRGLFMPWELEELLDPPFVEEGLKSLDVMARLERSTRGIRNPRNKVTALETTWYMRNQLLRDADWAGMAHGVEIRVPFVDKELFQTVASLTRDRAPTKQDMTAAVAKPLPPEIRHRRKTGFTVPVLTWQSGTRDNTCTANTRVPMTGMRAWACRVNPPTKRQRALALVSDAYGRPGGIALYNRDFLRALCAHPALGEVVVLPRLVNKPSGDLPAKLTHITASAGSKGRYVLTLARVLFARRDLNIIVCGHINLMPLAYFAHLVTGAPVVLLIYGIDAWTRSGGILMSLALRNVSAYVSISRITAERFTDWTREHNLVGYVVPNAIHLEHYRPGAKAPDLEARYRLSGKHVLLTLGRLSASERYKGVDEVMAVLPRLVAQVPTIIYVIAGDGDDLPRLKEKAIALGVQDHVVFTGFVPEEAKPALYRTADVYVMPSRGEGFGFVMLEALASGLPTIASKTDGGREALREGALGRLVDPDNAVELTEAILASLKMPKTVPQGLEYFAYEKFQARVHAMLDECLFPNGRVETQVAAEQRG